MILTTRTLGTGRPVLILHGLFGMSDNWLTIGKGLAQEQFTVHIPDLRNHGRSPHTASHRYTEICDDILGYLDGSGLDAVDIIGHSMGGKAAMILSLLYPERVNKLIVVDIAPSEYTYSDSGFHAQLIQTLLHIEEMALGSRNEIRLQLERRTGSPELAMFLAKNIVKRKDDSHFTWRCNLPVLKAYLRHLHTGFKELDLHAPSLTPTLFIKGELSDYYTHDNEKDRLYFFPNSSVATVPGADHWVHARQPEAVLSLVSAFLKKG